MNRLRNSLIGVASIAVIVTFLAANTKITHAVGGPVVVQIMGTASTKDVDSPDLQPVQFTLFPHSSVSNQAIDTFTVPAGKRLIIDYYSGQPQDLSGGAAGMVITTTANANFVQYLVYVNGSTTNAVNQPCHISADPGTTVEAFSFNPSASSTGGFVTCSGHYVNVP